MDTPTAEAPPATDGTDGVPTPGPARHYDALPGPRGLPWVGNALQIESTRFHRLLAEWAEAYGPLARFRIGKRRLLLVADHTLIAGILRNRPDAFHRTSRLQEIWTELGFAPGVFGANGDAWKRQRRMVMAGFDPAHVKAYYPAMRQVGQRLVRRWAGATAAGRTIELQPELMRYTVDTIAGLAFGAQVNTLESDDDVIQRHLDKVFPVMFKRILAPLPTWRWWPSAADKALAQSITEINRAIDGFIAEARARLAADPARRTAPPNLLEAMLVAADEPDSGIDDSQVAGNVLTMLLAGEDTTANTLAWLLHLLWTHPPTLERAIAEVRGTIADRSAPTLDELARLDWVEASAHEAMRLKPVAPIIPLQTTRELMIGDTRVPRGVVVISLMRRDSVSDAHLPNAAEFDPARWLGGEHGPGALAAAAKRVSMPFGAGPRICPGRYLALLEIKLAVAVLLANFDIESVGTAGGGEPQELLQFTMAPVGLGMRLRERAA